MTVVIRDSINNLIRWIIPSWVTSREKLRVLQRNYLEVKVSKTMGSKIGLNDDHIVQCRCKGGLNTHIGRSRKSSIGIAYRVLRTDILHCVDLL